MLQGLTLSQMGESSSSMTGYYPNTTPSDFLLGYFDFRQELLGWCLLIVLAFIVVYATFAILSLRFFNFLQR